VTFWFCLGVALLLGLFGVWYFLTAESGQTPRIWVFCLGMAGVFTIVGIVIRYAAKWAADHA